MAIMEFSFSIFLIQGNTSSFSLLGLNFLYLDSMPFNKSIIFGVLCNLPSLQLDMQVGGYRVEVWEDVMDTSTRRTPLKDAHLVLVLSLHFLVICLLLNFL